MKTALTYLLVLLSVAGQAPAQSPTDSIVVKMVKKDIKYYFHDALLSKRQLYEQLKTNKLAYKEVAGHKTENIMEHIFTYGGASLLIYSIGHYMVFSEVPEWPLVVGGAFFAFSIPVTITNKIHMRRAIRIYNRSLSE